MDKKLNVIEACDVFLPDVDGVITCISNYSKHMANSQNVTVVAPKNKKNYVDNFPYKVLRCKSVFISALNQFYGFPNLDKEFKKQVDELNPDIIHIHSPFNMAKYLIKVAKKKNVPIVATFHSNMEMIIKDVSKSSLIARLITKSMGKIYNKCDEVFVCSPEVEKQARRYGYKGKITYLPFGSDLPICENVLENRALANQKLSLDEDELVFIYVGRIMKLKRIDFIIKSLKVLKDKGKKFKFYVVGNGPVKKKLAKLIQKLDMQDCVFLMGYVERELFPLLLSRADLLLFPSIYDNFALVKIEACAYSTPGVFIKGSCAGYEITDGVNGFLSNDTVEDFALTIERAILDREKLKEIGLNARRDLYITWKDCSKAVEKRLIEIVEEKGKKIENEN